MYRYWHQLNAQVVPVDELFVINAQIERVVTIDGDPLSGTSANSELHNSLYFKIKIKIKHKGQYMYYENMKFSFIKIGLFMGLRNKYMYMHFILYFVCP